MAPSAVLWGLPPLPDPVRETPPEEVESPRPLLVCLNDGWGGEGLLESALRWSARSGEPVTAIHVVQRIPARRRDIRTAERALVHARAMARRAGAAMGELVVLAADVPEGLSIGSLATGGDVVLWTGEVALCFTLEALGVPFREMAWQPR
jgi:hypothetical protein